MSKQTVAVIDYGMGNLHSVASALQHVDAGVEVIVTADAEAIRAADRVIFPGVGAIRDCMAEILRLSIDQVVKEVVASKPLLAICVGMQALMERSAENGGVDCLGLLPGEVKFFSDAFANNVAAAGLKVPHMGWSQVEQLSAHPLWQGIEQNSRFYFVHSFYVEAKDESLVAASTDYGVPINAALHQDNLFAVQFHPEKSSDNGLQLLKNFLAWDGQS